MTVQILKRRFTVDEYHQMARAGILTEGDRVELIEGELVEMTPISSRHAACVDRLTRLFTHLLGEQAIVRVQGPIRLSPHSEPQPDLTVLRPRADFYAQAHPGPEDVMLVVEVAETSAEADRTVKFPLYAHAGIPEAWLVDLSDEQVEVSRQPTPQGYRDTRPLRRGQLLSLEGFPGLSLDTEHILG